jgi:hypothetical protein
MRFTDFGSVVKTYKKNFQLRKETFIAERKEIQEKKKKDREDRIEAVKAVQPLIKIKRSTSKKSNFLGDIKKFLGLMLAGFILQNLKTIISTLQEIYKKIEDLVKRTKEFVEGVIGGLQTFFEGLDDAKRKMDDLLSPILNADLSKFVPFQDQLDKVLTGVLGIAALITGLYQGGKAAGGDNLIDETAKGSAAGIDSAAQKKAARLKALQEAKELRAQKQAQRIAAREAVAKKLRAESNLTRIARQKLAQSAAEKSVKKAAAEAALRTALLREQSVTIGGSSATAKPTSPGAGIPSGAKITPDVAKLFKENLAKMSESPKYLEDLGNLGDLGDFTEPTIADQYGNNIKQAVNEAIEEKARRDLLKDAAFFKKAGIDPGKLFEEAQIDQFGEDLLKGNKSKSITSLDKLLGKPPSSQPSASDVNKFNQIMKNARGFIKPKNLKLLKGFAKDLGAGLAIEFFAGWAIDRGLEAIGRDEKTLLKERVKRFNQLSEEDQKSLIETYNNNLEKELEYQKTFFAKVDKVIALGDMTANEIKIKALASFLTAVSISGAGSVYDLVSAGPLPDYLGSDVDITLPSTPKISMPSGMPPLPPTGTGSAALAAAQQYGAPRRGGRKHAGQDFDITGNEKFYSRIGGVVIYAGDSGGAGGSGTGYGNVVDIYNKELDVTERIAEARTILPGVVKGAARIKPGQAVVQGEDLTPSGSIRTGVIHYEIRKGKAGRSGSFKGTLNPLEVLKNLKPPEEVSMKSSPSNLTSSAGLNQSTTYSDSGVAIRREVNNIIIPIAA